VRFTDKGARLSPPGHEGGCVEEPSGGAETASGSGPRTSLISSVIDLPVRPRSVVARPDPEELRTLTERMPNCLTTKYGNVNVQTRVVARSKASTFIVTDDPSLHRGQPTMTKEQGERMASIQDEYIHTHDMVVVDGYIGNDPVLRTPARLIIETGNANIAAMQQILYYPLDRAGESGFEPLVTVIYTPGLEARGFPNDRLIAVDLERGITRVFNSDYFGESKKGGLRMWNKLVYDRGGLAMHAGCKIIPVGDRTAWRSSSACRAPARRRPRSPSRTIRDRCRMISWRSCRMAASTRPKTAASRRRSAWPRRPSRRSTGRS